MQRHLDAVNKILGLCIPRQDVNQVEYQIEGGHDIHEDHEGLLVLRGELMVVKITLDLLVGDVKRDVVEFDS